MCIFTAFVPIYMIFLLYVYNALTLTNYNDFEKRDSFPGY